MEDRNSAEGKRFVAGWDIGGAHLKMALCENGVVTHSATLKTSMWLGIDEVRRGIESLRAEVPAGAANAFTMTAELSDGFADRREGVAGILSLIEEEFGTEDTRIYAGRAGFADTAQARGLAPDIASANWHATAALAASVVRDALFVDMGSTTTDILALRDGKVANTGYSDAERLLSGELVYTGFTRSALIGIAERVPVGGTMTPLMNEYFANTADIARILGMLDEADDQYPSADRREKTLTGSIGRLARMIGRDGPDLSTEEWSDIALWFSEHQLRMVHDGALRVAADHRLARGAPVVGAGIGRPQIRRLAARLERPFVDFGTLINAVEPARETACKAAPAAAVALLAAAEISKSADAG
ncbi:hydantoinase/oxoprolinase family protein [Ciceribacter lividus]|nr:hydantoinase/oxoprolinase family protein [Ciceribacter lividus]